MYLHDKLAQRIVERTQKIIPYPINVMDHTGIIIASTNPARKYQKHGGAVLALTELKPIEISNISMPDFPNVKPGINLPIIFEDQAIGVIGISGPIEEVRPFGQMMRMAAEMVVEYTSMLEMTRWSEHRLEELLLECIEPNASVEHITNMAAQLNVNISHKHAICIINVEESEHQQELTHVLNSWSRRRLKAKYSFKSTIVLLNVTEKEANHSDNIDDWRSITTYLSDSLSFPFRCALGAIYQKPENIYQAFESTKAVMQVGERLNPEAKYYRFADYELPALLEGRLSDWQKERLSTYAKDLELIDPTLLSTALCWFDNNCEIKATSAKLFIHPNTLRYRIKRIEEICNINLHSYHDMCRLYLSLIL